ncbi:MAG: DoxX family protein [Bacteroidota bacterium]|nr:DoxX family protein [Bacteroidota bacterium]
MSILFKARSGRFSISVGLLFIRLALGSMFLFAGARKILDLQGFIKTVQETGQMNDTLAFILAFILPFMEMIFGAFFLIGLFTPVASFFIACMSISFLMVLGIGHPELPFSYNFVFFACAIAVMFTGAGLISFDALIDRKKLPANTDINLNDKRTFSGPAKYENVNEKDAIFVEEKDLRRDTAKGEDING